MKKLLKTLIIIGSIFMLIFSFYDFLSIINKLNTRNTREHLSDVGKQTANTYSEIFQSLKVSIVNTSELISTSFESQKDIGNILENFCHNKNLFARVWYVDENHLLQNYYYKMTYRSKNDYIDKIFKGEAGITNSFISDYNHDEVIAIYAPVYKKNKVVGGVVGILDLNSENNNYIYQDVFDNQSYVFAVTGDGQIISKIKNTHTLYNGDNYFEFLEKEVHFDQGSYHGILEMIDKEKSGYFSFSYQKNKRYVYMTPVKINNWYIFTVISNKVIDQQNNYINQATSLLIIKISIFFLIMLFFIVRYFQKINSRYETINKELKTSNKKIALLLKQNSDRIFEYNIKNDSLTLDAWNDYPKLLLNSFLSNLHNYNFVSKEHEQLLKDSFHKIIETHQKVIFDAKFPYISKDDETWFHVSIIYNEDNEKLIGTLRNSSREMKEYNVLVQDHMFKNSIYSQAFAMFAVNLKTRKVVIYQTGGIYYNAIDVEYNDEFINKLLKNTYKKDRDKVRMFFNYKRVQNLYHHHDGHDRIEFRIFNEQTNDYMWIRFRIQFERQSSNNELLMIAYANNIHSEKLRQLENEFKAQRDGLTGLYNRQTFNQLVDDYLKEEFSVARYDAYMIVDLDDFKSINDTLGHSYGDEVIQRVADILENNCYESGYVGRFGGDEFVIFLYDQESNAQIENKVRKILREINGIKFDKYCEISASIGMTFVKKEKFHQELFEMCDKALYVCKNSGKNRFFIYTENEDIDE